MADNIARGMVQNHIQTTGNPHGTTKSDIGLGNVTNDAQVKRSEMGAKNGVALYNSTLQLKRTVTLTESAATIVVSTDSTGANLNLKRAEIIIYGQSGASQAGLYLRLNGDTSNKYYWLSSLSTYFFTGYINTNFFTTKINLDTIAGRVRSFSAYTHVNSGGTITSSQSAGIYNDGSVVGINSFYIYSDINLPAGTVVEFWGTDV